MRTLLGAGPILLLGCTSLLELDSLKKVDCAGSDCGGTSQAASPSGLAGSNGAEAGSSSGSHAGHGAASGAGSTSGGSANGADGGESAEMGGSGSPAGSGGTSVAGSGAANGGGGSGGAGGQAGGGCQPTAVDELCDGLDEACQVTAQDAGCSGTCTGAFVNGSAYMSCLAASDFDQAEAACVANGMHLAKVDSAAENATVLGLAADDYVWIGGSNRANEAVFEWMNGADFYSSGAPVGGAYQNFAAGEPMVDAQLRCVQLMQPDDGTWSNWLCSETQSFVCERY